MRLLNLLTLWPPFAKPAGPLPEVFGEVTGVLIAVDTDPGNIDPNNAREI